MGDLPPKPETIYAKAWRHLERRKKGPTARRRAAKSRTRKAIELNAMLCARERDRYCRFPLCCCDVFSPRVPSATHINGLLEVSHQSHRGMGGNPTGDRTTTAGLLLLCNWRHKLSKFSIDRHGIRWEALTEQGADGPIRWLISLRLLQECGMGVRVGVTEISVDGWIGLVREVAPHELEPLTPTQSVILSWLAEMTV